VLLVVFIETTFNHSMNRFISMTLLFIIFQGTSIAQSLTQNVRGHTTDAESKQPLVGVVVVLQSDKSKTATTDENGFFLLKDITVGRQSFQFIMTGYENTLVSEAMVISGKELELNISMKEKLQQLNEVVVSANKDKTRAKNEFAMVSSRSFSVEETRRYAASFADPARMVMNFAGVSSNGDMDNSIVVRGNSPKGILWRLEGIEIPNPNHFSELGNSGGAISMLNANVLGTSDFYTGAFPAEIGNATAGAFDLSFRNGNTERREHSVQIGTLGAELATEGPFKQGKKASYLFTYRYSTLALLNSFMDLGGALPDYQDAAFKINLPTDKLGTFSVFGLGGYNKVYRQPKEDSSSWTDDEPNVSFLGRNKTGIAGIAHQYFLTRNSYLKTIVSASIETTDWKADTLNVLHDYREDPIEKNRMRNSAWRASISYNNKLSVKNTFRTGLVAHRLGYNMDYSYFDVRSDKWNQILQGEGSTQFYQAFAQWKSRISERLTVTGGIHGSFLALNNTYSIEPRVAAAYDIGKQQISLAAGLHSKPEHLSTYLFKDAAQGTSSSLPNKELDLSKSAHLVAGYNTRIAAGVRLKAEVYYQYLYDMPVEKDSATGFSMINAAGASALLGTKPLVSEGKGENYGIDITVERPFSKGFYLMATASVYRSTYTDYAGNAYNTKFNRGYQANLIGGKEWKLNANGRKLFGLNGKILLSGGLRESEIDLERSLKEERTVYVPEQYFTNQGSTYFRADMSAYYKFNTRNATHSILLEVQNFTNHQNYYASFFDSRAGKIRQVNQLGILPNLAYRIDFHW